jgi:hypothetical protein
MNEECQADAEGEPSSHILVTAVVAAFLATEIRCCSPQVVFVF